MDWGACSTLFWGHSFSISSSKGPQCELYGAPFMVLSQKIYDRRLSVILEMEPFVGWKTFQAAPTKQSRVLFKILDEYPRRFYMGVPLDKYSVINFCFPHLCCSKLTVSSCCYWSFPSSDFPVDFSYCFALEKRSSTRLCKFGSCSNER